MKTLVVTDTSGEITGLVRFEEEEVEGGPAEVAIVPLEGQRIHEVELPPELEKIESVVDLYSALEQSYAVDTDSATLIHRAETSR